MLVNCFAPIKSSLHTDTSIQSTKAGGALRLRLRVFCPKVPFAFSRIPTRYTNGPCIGFFVRCVCARLQRSAAERPIMITTLEASFMVIHVDCGYRVYSGDELN